MAGGPQAQIAHKGANKGVLPVGGQIAFAIGPADVHRIGGPAGVLGPEVDGGGTHASGGLLAAPGKVPLPNGGGGHTVAHQVHQQQIVVIPAQIGPQPRHLAGRSGKQHLAALCQKGLHLGENALQAALGIFGPPEAVQLLGPLHQAVHHPEIGVVCRAEHRAAPVQHILSQKGEHAAGGADPPDGLVLVFCGKGLGHRRAVRGEQHRTHPAAKAAAGAAAFLHHGAEEAFGIRLHGDAAQGTGGSAGGTAGAKFLFTKAGHEQDLLFSKIQRISEAMASDADQAVCR